MTLVSETKTPPWTEQWTRMPCPVCGKINWACFGSSSDDTSPDVEAIKCHSCGMVFRLCEDLDIYDPDPDNWYVEDGLERP